MTIYISSKLDKDFIFQYLPTFIYKKWVSSIGKNRLKIEKILEENSITISKFIEELKKVFSIKKFGNYYIISTKNNNIDTIMRTIDYGSTSISPQHIFDKDVEYVKNNLTSIYELWLNNVKV